MINASFNTVPDTINALRKVRLAPAFAELAKAQKAESKATTPKPTKAPKTVTVKSTTAMVFDLEHVITRMSKDNSLKGMRGQAFDAIRSGMKVESYVAATTALGIPKPAALIMLKIMVEKSMMSVAARAKKSPKSAPAVEVAA